LDSIERFAQTVKNPARMQEMRVQSLGQEVPLENEMITHCRILPKKFQGQRSLADYSSWSCKALDMTEVTEHACRHKRFGAHHQGSGHPTPALLPGKIPWMEEPDGLQSRRSLRVGHD